MPPACPALGLLSPAPHKRAVPDLLEKSDNNGELGTAPPAGVAASKDQEARYRVCLRAAPRVGLTTAKPALTFTRRGPTAPSDQRGRHQTPDDHAGEFGPALRFELAMDRVRMRSDRSLARVAQEVHFHPFIYAALYLHRRAHFNAVCNARQRHSELRRANLVSVLRSVPGVPILLSWHLKGVVFGYGPPAFLTRSHSRVGRRRSIQCNDCRTEPLPNPFAPIITVLSSRSRVVSSMALSFLG